jgi:hypothetical protein
MIYPKLEAVLAETRSCYLDREATVMLFVTRRIENVAVICWSLPRRTEFERLCTGLLTLF